MGTAEVGVATMLGEAKMDTGGSGPDMDVWMLRSTKLVASDPDETSGPELVVAAIDVTIMSSGAAVVVGLVVAANGEPDASGATLMKLGISDPVVKTTGAIAARAEPLGMPMPILIAMLTLLGTIPAVITRSAIDTTGSIETDEVDCIDVTGIVAGGAVVGGIEVKGIDVRGIDVRGIDVSGIEVKGIEVKGIEVKGIDVSGIEVNSEENGIDVSGIDVRGAEVNAMDVNGAETEGIDEGGRDADGRDTEPKMRSTDDSESEGECEGPAASEARSDAIVLDGV
nr:hypothetical protein HK105_007128 [Polyrhizophydium stewartii]